MAQLGAALMPGDVGPPLPTAMQPGNIGPQPTAAAAGPAEYEQNKGLWRGFLDKMRTDPNFKQAVQVTAMGMMRSPQMGQNGFDVASQALTTGVTTLDMLRQRDRTQAIEDEERARKAGLEERGAQVAERGASSQERNAATAEQEVKQRAEDSMSRWRQAQNELEEAIRHNKASEEIDRLRANADSLRASAYMSYRKDRPAAEVVKLNALSAKYQQDGIDPITADAMATERLLAGKSKAPGDRVRAAVDARIKAYSGSLESFDKPLSNEMIQQWLQEELEREKYFQSLETPGAQQGAPRAAPSVIPQANSSVPSSADFAAQPVAPSVNPGRTPPTTAAAPRSAAISPGGTPNPSPGVDGGVVPQNMPEPKVANWVTQQVRAGTPPEAIRAQLVQYGKNPALYGF